MCPAAYCTKFSQKNPKEKITMRAVLTRVKSASVTVDGREIANIGKGFLILLGVTH